MVENEAVPEKYGPVAADPSYGKFKVLLRRRSNLVRLTLFEGGHNCVAQAGAEWLARQHRFSVPDWNVGKLSENGSAIELAR